MSGTLLLVDVGNSRIKWCRRRAGRAGAAHSVEHHGRLGPPLRRALGRAARGAERVVFVSVARPSLTRELQRLLERAAAGRVQRVRSGAAALGVRNAYREPWRLGADRWAALLGARRVAPPGRAVLVVNVGTAVTLDLLAADGRHRGGAILPGSGLMQRCLLEGTGGISRRARGRRASRSRDGWLARDTAAALRSGTALAIAGAIERAVRQVLSFGSRRPLLLLTGGGARSVSRALTLPHRVVPDLVLRGLAALAAAHSRRYAGRNRVADRR
ncbi:MAG: type III pantothenate kinase [Steroidobacteraceae bacterium]|nr:type III pantothenate kinase [Steroidobacteraceae bacterium]MDW8259065.1 type III pantothenate kinase [Gammaproteobacteria bacterium]